MKTMQRGGPAPLDHRCIVAYGLMVGISGCFLFTADPVGARELEDFAEVYVDEYFKPAERLLLTEQGKRKSQALANFALGRSLEAQGRPLEAVEAYRKVLENQPDRYFLARKTAYLLARSGQQSDALDVLETSLSNNPDEPFAYIALSEYLATYQANDPDASKRSFEVIEEALRKFPDEPAVYDHIVKLYLTANRRPEAEAVIRAAVERDNKDPFFWLSIGQITGRILPVRGDEGSDDLSLLNTIYSKASDRAGENPEVLEAVGDFYHATKQFVPAVEIYQGIIENSPDRLDVREKLARVYGGMGDREKVIETLQEIVEIDPENARVHKQIAEIYMRNEEFRPAIPHLRKALAITKGSAAEYGALGQMMLDSKEFEIAAEFLDETAYLFPEAPQFRFLMAMALGQLDRWGEAVEQYKETEKIAAEHQPQLLNEGFYFQYAAAHERAGNIEAATELFQKSIGLLAKNDPENENQEFAATLYNYLGYMWIENDLHIEEAGELIKTAAELDPESGAIADSLGWYYFKKGDYAAAKEELLRAEQLIEQADPVIFDHIGQVHFHLGEKESAIEYLKKAIEMDPENEEFIDRLKEYESGGSESPAKADSTPEPAEGEAPKPD